MAEEQNDKQNQKKSREVTIRDLIAKSTVRIADEFKRAKTQEQRENITMAVDLYGIALTLSSTHPMEARRLYDKAKLIGRLKE